MYIKEKELCPAYISKTNSNYEKQIILLIIVNGITALFHGINSKHKGDFHCLNCLHSFRTENKLKNYVKKNIFVEL